MKDFSQFATAARLTSKHEFKIHHPKNATRKSGFPIFRKSFQKHGKRRTETLTAISPKRLCDYELSKTVRCGIEIAYTKAAHP
jgi:hypothetical protein